LVDLFELNVKLRCQKVKVKPFLVHTVYVPTCSVTVFVATDRQKQTSGPARLHDIKKNLSATLSTSSSRSLHLQGRTVTSQLRCSGTSVSARSDVFLSLYGKWNHFLSAVLLHYVATRIFTKTLPVNKN